MELIWGYRDGHANWNEDGHANLFTSTDCVGKDKIIMEVIFICVILASSGIPYQLGS